MATQKAVSNEKDLFMDPKTGIFYGQVYIIAASGERVRKVRSLKVKDLRKARIELRELANKLMVQGKSRKLRRLFKEEEVEWLALHKESRWKPGTFVDIESKFRLHLEPFFKSYPVDSIDEHAWEEYIADKWASQPGLKLKLHGDYLSMFLHHCKRKGLVLSVPVFRNPDATSEGGKRYSRAEQARLLWFSRKGGHRSKTIQLQLLMGLKMGMRKNEILKLHKDRIDWEATIVRLQASDTKTDKARIIPIPKMVFKRLRKQCRDTASNPYVFPNQDDPLRPQASNKTAWQLLKVRAGVKGRFHDLRHTCASEMADRGVQTVVAARILGMSALVFEKIYCKPSEDALKKAML